MTLTHKDLGGYPPERFRQVLLQLKNELFYLDIREQAAKRRAKNPGAYVLPPGHQPIKPPEYQGHCPHCGQPLA